jgi:hypothetical protein
VVGGDYFLVTTHYVFKWFLTFRLSFFGGEPLTHDRPWAAASRTPFTGSH